MNHFIYSLGTQFVNTGDLLINKTLIMLLSKHGVIYLDDFDKPVDFVESLIVNDNVVKISEISGKRNIFSSKLNSASFIKQLNIDTGDKVFFILVPGDISKKGSKMFFQTVILLLRTIYFKINRINIFQVGFSLGSFDLFNIILTRLNTSLYLKSGLRDKGSIKKAQQFGFKNISYFPDLAWAFSRADFVIPEESRNCIIISFRAYDKATNENLLSAIIDLIRNDKLDKSKIRVCFQVDYDKQFSYEIYTKLQEEKFDVEFIDSTLTIEKALEVYADSLCVLSNRLHVLMLALKVGTMPIPVVQKKRNPKIINIFDDNGLHDLMIIHDENTSFEGITLNKILNAKSEWSNIFLQLERTNTALINSELEELIQRGESQ